MPIHIRAEPGEYAEACLLPGDPLRAKYIAETYLDNAVQRNSERGMLGYTGEFEGRPVSVQSTGMGCPSAAIVIEELVQLGVKRLLRVGTCGGLQTDLALGELIVAVTAVPADATARHLVGTDEHCPTASWRLVHGAVHAAKEIGQPMRVGPIVSSDLFYNPDEGQYERWSKRVTLAVIARGTGWDFIRTYGIPHAVAGAVDVARDGVMREIDLGRVTYHAWRGGEASSYFANVASAGMSGAIAQRANETTKALGGKASYLWATLAVFAGWKVSEVGVTVDGQQRAGRMHDVVVANGRYFGGGMMIVPEASPDDGLLDVLLIGDLTKRDLLLTLPKTYRGRHLPHPKAESLRGKTVTVDAPEPLPIELDGEQPGTTPARFEILPRALRLRVPR